MRFFLKVSIVLLALAPMARAQEFDPTAAVLDSFQEFCVAHSASYSDLVSKAQAKNFPVIRKLPDIQSATEVTHGIEFAMPVPGVNTRLGLFVSETSSGTAVRCMVNFSTRSRRDFKSAMMAKFKIGQPGPNNNTPDFVEGFNWKNVLGENTFMYLVQVESQVGNDVMIDYTVRRNK